MNSLKIIIIFFLAVTAPLVAQESKVVSLEMFDQLKVYDQIYVTLIESTENKALILGKKRDGVKVVQENGEVKIKMGIENMLDGEGITVRLYHTEKLSLIDANENAKISSENELNPHHLTLRVQEGSEIDITINTPSLKSKAVTGGVIKVAGQTNSQKVRVRTGGTYLGQNLTSQITDVMVFAGGEAFVFATDFAEANVTAGGTIDVFGDPDVWESNELGGKITFK